MLASLGSQWIYLFMTWSAREVAMVYILTLHHYKHIGLGQHVPHTGGKNLQIHQLETWVFCKKNCCILCFKECRPHHTNLEHPQLLFNVAHNYNYDSCNLCFKIVLTLALKYWWRPMYTTWNILVFKTWFIVKSINVKNVMWRHHCHQSASN
jgi:hypothetical protein